MAGGDKVTGSETLDDWAFEHEVGEAPRRSFAAILQTAQELTRESDPDSIQAISAECLPLSKIEQRRVLDAIKLATKIPLSILNAAVRESVEFTQEPDQLALARKIIDEVGAENILSADSSVWYWDQSGVWLKLDGRSVKQIVQQRIPEGEGDRSMIDGVTDIMQTEIHKPFHVFNVGHPEAVNCLNGEIVLDGNEWKLVPHCRENYRTTQIPVMFDPEATAPKFGQFLIDVFIGDDDTQDKIRAVLEMIGYTLMAHCRHEKFVILVGGGANGKSVMLSVIEALLGFANIAGVQPSMFDRTFQRAHLHMKLANIVTEIKQGEVIDDASLKGIVSGEPTTVEQKFKDPFVMRPFSTCWFGTNHMPSTRDFSDALFRRALVIPFNNVFKPELNNCDPQLKDKLVTELPGILNMALRAYQRALEQGFTMPASCIKARDEWRLEADQVAQFVDERCERDQFGSMPVGDLFSAYQRWATDSGISRPVSMKSFRDRMEKLGYGNKRTKTTRLVTGIRLNKG
jgi:putative DNA primase/helicase